MVALKHSSKLKARQLEMLRVRKDFERAVELSWLALSKAHTERLSVPIRYLLITGVVREDGFRQT